MDSQPTLIRTSIGGLVVGNVLLSVEVLPMKYESGVLWTVRMLHLQV